MPPAFKIPSNVMAVSVPRDTWDATVSPGLIPRCCSQPGELIGAAVQLLVGQGSRVVPGGDAIGRIADLFFKQTVGPQVRA